MRCFQIESLSPSGFAGSKAFIFKVNKKKLKFVKNDK